MNANIEKYIRFPNSLSAEKKAEVEFMLSTSAAAKKWYDWLVAYYKEYDVAKPSEHSVIQKIPMRMFRPDSPLMEDKSLWAVTLAARSVSTERELLFCMVADDNKTVLRIFNNYNKSYLIFLVQHGVQTSAQKSIKIEGLEREFVFGPSKIIEIPKSELPASFKIYEHKIEFIVKH